MARRSAEIGAAYLCAEAGMSTAVLEKSSRLYCRLAEEASR